MLNSVKSFVTNHKFAACAAVGTALTAVPTCAAETTSGYIQAAWLDSLLPNITADVTTLMPIGIGIFALFIGVGLIPKVIYKFLG